ncbi:MAG: ABC transporter permease [Opitutae bacterium]|nr:ABC transporter permease [Opitutae bacterium]
MNSLRFAFRLLLRQKSFSFIAAFSLALGIGLVATQFSLIDGILLRGIPAPDAQRIMHIGRLAPASQGRDGWELLPYRDFIAFRDRQTSFDLLVGATTGRMNLSAPGRMPSSHPGGFVTYNVPELMGAQPMLGRWFTATEDQIGKPTLVVLSHKLWQEEFASDPSVLGQPLSVNGVAGTIIGVMPPHFSFPSSERLWVNLRPGPNDPRTTPVDRAEMIGRLKPGVSVEQARAEFDGIAASLERQWPESNRGYNRMDIDKIAFAYAGGGTVPILALLLAMTVFILALACVNVANMLLGRAAQRTRELAVRAAVGASRARLVRQLLGEALLLAGLGAVGGLIAAQFGVDLLDTYLAHQPFTPDWFDFRLDYRVVGATALLTVLAGLFAGIMPAVQASRLDVNTALKDDARAAASMGLGRVARWLVTAQIAFSSALLVAACVLGWTVYETRQTNLRYDPDRLLRGRIEIYDAVYPSLEKRAQFFRELMERLRSEPGVDSVAVTSRAFIGNGVPTPVAPEGVVFKHANERPSLWLEVVSTDYFKLAGVTALRGRLFDAREQSLANRVAVINESFARKFWSGQDPIDRRFQSSQTPEGEWITVIGVVPDMKMQGLFAPPGIDEAGFYLVQDQMGWGWLDIFIRTKGDPLQYVTPVRKAIASLDPNQPIHSIGTLTSITAQAARGFTIVGVMAGIFAGVTLFLGAIGVYGVTSLAVSRRTREFGVRMALGATVGQVLRLVLVQGGRQIGLGLGVGLVGGFLLTRPVQSIFGPGVMNNPVVYLVVAAVIALVGLLALWLPAHRAARLDPMVALRSE